MNFNLKCLFSHKWQIERECPKNLIKEGFPLPFVFKCKRCGKNKIVKVDMEIKIVLKKDRAS